VNIGELLLTLGIKVDDKQLLTAQKNLPKFVDTMQKMFNEVEKNGSASTKRLSQAVSKNFSGIEKAYENTSRSLANLRKAQAENPGREVSIVGNQIRVSANNIEIASNTNLAQSIKNVGALRAKQVGAMNLFQKAQINNPSEIGNIFLKGTQVFVKGGKDAINTVEKLGVSSTRTGQYIEAMSNRAHGLSTVLNKWDTYLNTVNNSLNANGRQTVQNVKQYANLALETQKLQKNSKGLTASLNSSAVVQSASKIQNVTTEISKFGSGMASSSNVIEYQGRLWTKNLKYLEEYGKQVNVTSQYVNNLIKSINTAGGGGVGGGGMGSKVDKMLGGGTRKVTSSFIQEGATMKWVKGVAAGMLLYRGLMVVMNGVATAITEPIKAFMEFEDAFGNIRKVLDASGPEFQRLSDQFRELALVVPLPIVDLIKIGTVVAQLGVGKENIVKFTETVARLVATADNLSAEEAAMSLAKFANVTRMSMNDVGKLGSTILYLGNRFAATEKDLINMSQRMGSAGTQIKLTQAEILAFGAAMLDTGVKVEYGGTAMSKVFTDMAKAVAKNDDKLKQIAKVAEKPVKDFVRLFKTDASEAILAFMQGLSKMDKSSKEFNTAMEIFGKNSRIGNVLRSLTNGIFSLEDALGMQAKAWKNEGYLVDKSTERWKTNVKQLQLFKSTVNDLAISVGGPLTGGLMSMVKGLWLVVTGTREAKTGVVALTVALGTLTALSVGKNLFNWFGSVSNELASNRQGLRIISKLTEKDAERLVAATSKFHKSTMALAAGSKDSYIVTIPALTGIHAATARVIDAFKTLGGLKIGTGAAGNINVLKNAAAALGVTMRGLMIFAKVGIVTTVAAVLWEFVYKNEKAMSAIRDAWEGLKDSARSIWGDIVETARIAGKGLEKVTLGYIQKVNELNAKKGTYKYNIGDYEVTIDTDIMKEKAKTLPYDWAASITKNFAQSIAGMGNIAAGFFKLFTGEFTFSWSKMCEGLKLIWFGMMQELTKLDIMDVLGIGPNTKLGTIVRKLPPTIFSLFTGRDNSLPKTTTVPMETQIGNILNGMGGGLKGWKATSTIENQLGLTAEIIAKLQKVNASAIRIFQDNANAVAALKEQYDGTDKSRRKYIAGLYELINAHGKSSLSLEELLNSEDKEIQAMYEAARPADVLAIKMANLGDKNQDWNLIMAQSAQVMVDAAETQMNAKVPMDTLTKSIWAQSVAWLANRPNSEMKAWLDDVRSMKLPDVFFEDVNSLRGVLGNLTDGFYRVSKSANDMSLSPSVRNEMSALADKVLEELENRNAVLNVLDSTSDAIYRITNLSDKELERLGLTKAMRSAILEDLKEQSKRIQDINASEQERIKLNTELANEEKLRLAKESNELYQENLRKSLQGAADYLSIGEKITKATTKSRAEELRYLQAMLDTVVPMNALEEKLMTDQKNHYDFMIREAEIRLEYETKIAEIQREIDTSAMNTDQKRLKQQQLSVLSARELEAIQRNTNQEAATLVAQQRKQYKAMVETIKEGAGQVWDAMKSDSKDAFGSILDWIEGAINTRLRTLFQNFVSELFTGFKGGLGSLLQGVIPDDLLKGIGISKSTQKQLDQVELVVTNTMKTSAASMGKSITDGIVNSGFNQSIDAFTAVSSVIEDNTRAIRELNVSLDMGSVGSNGSVNDVFNIFSGGQGSSNVLLQNAIVQGIADSANTLSSSTALGLDTSKWAAGSIDLFGSIDKTMEDNTATIAELQTILSPGMNNATFGQVYEAAATGGSEAVTQVVDTTSKMSKYLSAASGAIGGVLTAAKGVTGSGAGSWISAISGGAMAGASIGMLLGGPIGAVVLGAVGAVYGAIAKGIYALVDWISGPDAYEKAASELKTKYKLSFDPKALQQWYNKNNMGESNAWNIKGQSLLSPKFITEMAYPAAQEQGKLEAYRRSLQSVSVENTGKYNFLPSFDIGRLTGDWTALNKIYKEMLAENWKSTKMSAANKEWLESLVVEDSALKGWEQAIVDLNDLKNSIKDSIPSIADMYSEFFETGKITEKLRESITEMGMSIKNLGAFEKYSSLMETKTNFEDLISTFRETGEVTEALSKIFADFGGSLDVLNDAAQLKGLKNSLDIVSNLKTGLQNLAPELDPINALLEGKMNANVMTALTGAGLDPAMFTKLTELINLRNVAENFEPFMTMTSDLKKVLSSYGGTEGTTAITNYAQGFNTVTEALLTQTVATMNEAFLKEVQTAVEYLGTKEDAISSEITTLTTAMETQFGIISGNITTAIDSAKTALIASIDELILIVATRQSTTTDTGTGTGTGIGIQLSQAIIDYIVTSAESGMSVAKIARVLLDTYSDINAQVNGLSDLFAFLNQIQAVIAYASSTAIPSAASGGLLRVHDNEAILNAAQTRNLLRNESGTADANIDWGRISQSFRGFAGSRGHREKSVVFDHPTIFGWPDLVKMFHKAGVEMQGRGLGVM
jgi:TP901 family phage tail tape measure protein